MHSAIELASYPKSSPTRPTTNQTTIWVQHITISGFQFFLLVIAPLIIKKLFFWGGVGGAGEKWVPESELLRTQLIQRIHDFLFTGHFGREKTVTATLMFKRYFWPNIFLNIWRSVRNCDVSGKIKIWIFWFFFKNLVFTKWHLVKFFINFVIDLFESERCKNFLVITDKLKKGHFKTLPLDEYWNGCRNIYSTFFCQHGLPTSIISDRNRQFMNFLQKTICKIFGIQRNFYKISHLKIDGATKRINQKIKSFCILILILTNAIGLSLCL